MPSAKFDELFQKTRKIESGPSNEEQLNLYAWGKIAKGESIEGRSRPGVLSFKDRAMYDSWMKWTKEGISQADAEKRYIELAEELCNKYLK